MSVGQLRAFSTADAAVLTRAQVAALSPAQLRAVGGVVAARMAPAPVLPG
jgi:hypothetical protein